MAVLYRVWSHAHLVVPWKDGRQSLLNANTSSMASPATRLTVLEQLMLHLRAPIADRIRVAAVPPSLASTENTLLRLFKERKIVSYHLRGTCAFVGCLTLVATHHTLQHLRIRC